MIHDLFCLDGRVAIVTGGGRGLGAAMAKGLAVAGARVVVCSRHLDQCTNVVVEIEQHTGRRGLSIEADVTSRVDVERLTSEVLRNFGRVDILVNNAGVQLPKPMLELKDDEWMRVMEINYKGAFLCSQIIGRHLVAQKSGRVINISSVLGSAGQANVAAYAPTKGALLQLTRVLALEWAPHNVLVNAICPGPFLTPMNQEVMENAEAYRLSCERVPLKRWGTPDEINGAVIYLASNASSYVTGSLLYVDGGWTV